MASVESVECQICAEPYDTEVHVPKRLLCMHIMCVVCARSVIRKGMMKCPFCNTQQKVANADYLPIDTVIIERIESMSESKCDDCSKPRRVSECSLCPSRCCASCLCLHKSRDHCNVLSHFKELDEMVNEETLKQAKEAKSQIEKEFPSPQKLKIEVGRTYDRIIATLTERRQATMEIISEVNERKQLLNDFIACADFVESRKTTLSKGGGNLQRMNEECQKKIALLKQYMDQKDKSSFTINFDTTEIIHSIGRFGIVRSTGVDGTSCAVCSTKQPESIPGVDTPHKQPEPTVGTCAGCLVKRPEPTPPAVTCTACCHKQPEASPPAFGTCAACPPKQTQPAPASVVACSFCHTTSTITEQTELVPPVPSPPVIEPSLAPPISTQSGIEAYAAPKIADRPVIAPKPAPPIPTPAVIEAAPASTILNPAVIEAAPPPPIHSRPVCEAAYAPLVPTSAITGAAPAPPIPTPPGIGTGTAPPIPSRAVCEAELAPLIPVPAVTGVGPAPPIPPPPVAGPAPAPLIPTPPVAGAAPAPLIPTPPVAGAAPAPPIPTPLNTSVIEVSSPPNAGSQGEASHESTGTVHSWPARDIVQRSLRRQQASRKDNDSGRNTEDAPSGRGQTFWTVIKDIDVCPSTGLIYLGDQTNRGHCLIHILDPGLDFFRAGGFKVDGVITALAVISEELVAMTDYDGHCVRIYSTAGDQIRMFGSEGDGNREFSDPCGIAHFSQRLFVADCDNDRICVWTVDGKLCSPIQHDELKMPVSVAINGNGDLFVSSTVQCQILVFSVHGHLKMTFSNAGRYDLPTVWLICIDNENNLYALGRDRDNDEVVVDVFDVGCRHKNRILTEIDRSTETVTGLGITNRGDIVLAATVGKKSSKLTII